MTRKAIPLDRHMFNLLILYFFDLRGFKDKKFSEKMTGLWQMLKINQYIDIDDIDILDI